jgi:hypothetical protein
VDFRSRGFEGGGVSVNLEAEVLVDLCGFPMSYLGVAP